MGQKRRYKIKKQQRWKRRMARRKLAFAIQRLQSQPTAQVEQSAQSQLQPQPTQETSPTSTQTE